MDKKLVVCYCNSCEKDTNHEILTTQNMTSSDEEYWWSTDYHIVKCFGCETVSFLTATNEESEVEYGNQGEMYFLTRYQTYPYHKRLADPIRDLWPIPTSIARIYKETVNSLNNDFPANVNFRITA